MGLNVEDIPYIALKCFERVPDLQVAIQARKRRACRSSELLQRTGIVRCMTLQSLATIGQLVHQAMREMIDTLTDFAK